MLKVLQNRETSMDPIIEKLQIEIRAFDLLPSKVRDSHLNKKRAMLGDSVFTYREPTIIRENRTLIGTQSIVMGKKAAAAKNQKTKSSRGFCSIFGFGSK